MFAGGHRPPAIGCQEGVGEDGQRALPGDGVADGGETAFEVFLQTGQVYEISL